MSKRSKALAAIAKVMTDAEKVAEIASRSQILDAASREISKSQAVEYRRLRAKATRMYRDSVATKPLPKEK